MPRRILLRLLLVVLSALVAVAVVEVALRIAQLNPEQAPMESDPILHHVHPRDHLFRAFNLTPEYGGFLSYFDREGRAASVARARTPAPPDNADCRIALMGDSYVEARQVVYEQSFAGLLAASTDCSIRNYGVASYSPALELLQWRSDVRLWKPTHVVLLLSWNDAADDREYLKAARFDGEGLPVAVPGPPGDEARRFLRRLYVARVVRAARLLLRHEIEHHGKDRDDPAGRNDEDPAFEGSIARLVGRLATDVTNSGATFYLGVVPSRKMMNGLDTFTGGRLHHSAQAWSQANRVAFIDLESAFTASIRAGRGQLYFRRDMHFTTQGHLAAAAALSAALSDVVRPISAP